MNIDMCAKFRGAWDKNDLKNMDLRMSAGPVLCCGGTPKFGAFFSNYLVILNIFGRKYLLLCKFLKKWHGGARKAQLSSLYFARK